MSDRVTGEPDVRLQRSFAMTTNGAKKWYSDPDEDDPGAAEERILFCLRDSASNAVITHLAPDCREAEHRIYIFRNQDYIWI